MYFSIRFIEILSISQKKYRNAGRLDLGDNLLTNAIQRKIYALGIANCSPGVKFILRVNNSEEQSFYGFFQNSMKPLKV